MAKDSIPTDAEFERYIKSKNTETGTWTIAIDKEKIRQGNDLWYTVKALYETDRERILYEYSQISGIKKANIHKLTFYPYRIFYRLVEEKIVKDFLSLKKDGAVNSNKVIKDFISRWYPEVFV